MLSRSKKRVFMGVALGIASLLSAARGAEIAVSTFAELESAAGSAVPGDHIVLADGTFTISGTWAVQIGTSNVTVRSASGNRTNVVVEGWGMQGNGHHGFYVSADDVTIRDLTIRNVRNHCIQTGGDVDRLRVLNCVLQDAGEQMLKGAGASDVNDDCLVEGCLFEYRAGVGPRDYIGGIDVHAGRNWVVRNNVFRDIQSPGVSIAEHAIHFWSESAGTLVEGNVIVNCDRGIGFGLGGSGHSGGVVRNNMIYHDGSGAFADVGIGLESSPDSEVYNNTVYLDHDRYGNAIEYRFAATRGVLIVNNLVNKAIRSREGGSGEVHHNHTSAERAWFVAPGEGDLHLTGSVAVVVDQGTNVTGLARDFDGDVRPRGMAPDIGADELTDNRFSAMGAGKVDDVFCCTWGPVHRRASYSLLGATRVQASNWLAVGEAVTATGNTVTLQDAMTESSDSGFYRAVRVP